MVGVQEFLQELEQGNKPVGVGLITLNPDPPGPTMVICVDNPRFMKPLPVDFDYPIKKLLSVPFDIIEEVIDEHKAVPIEEMIFWWSYAIYE